MRLEAAVARQIKTVLIDRSVNAIRTIENVTQTSVEAAKAT